MRFYNFSKTDFEYKLYSVSSSILNRVRIPIQFCKSMWIRIQFLAYCVCVSRFYENFDQYLRFRVIGKDMNNLKKKN